jgi:hypothetical protein
MTQKLQITHICLLLLLMALSSVALAPSPQALLSVTHTPKIIKPAITVTRVVKLRPTFTAAQPREITVTPVKTRSSSLPPGAQAGTSDWIVVIGVLIVAIIVIPILIKRKEWRG